MERLPPHHHYCRGKIFMQFKSCLKQQGMAKHGWCVRMIVATRQPAPASIRMHFYGVYAGGWGGCTNNLWE
ncbi:hypothetical protein BUE76_01545 [Cnuella takakiae]|nr:hypothetical protein BUE76_01545 [Cnuella takakiae]